MKQFLFKYVTTPIAKIIDFFNFSKREQIYGRRTLLALSNKREYIETTSKLLFEQDIQKYIIENKTIDPQILSIIAQINISKACQMFEEKKKNGDFDELNLMIK